MNRGSVKDLSLLLLPELIIHGCLNPNKVIRYDHVIYFNFYKAKMTFIG